MKTSTIHVLKKELHQKSLEELIDITLRLGKFKKENKELLTYLLFEQQDEQGFIASIKAILGDQFKEIRNTNVYLARKAIRKSLRELKKFIRFSGLKTTELDLLIEFVKQIHELPPRMKDDSVIGGIEERQFLSIEKIIDKLHEDLQFDYREILINELNIPN